MEQIIKRGVGGEVIHQHRQDGLIISGISNAEATIYRNDGSILKETAPCGVDVEGTMAIAVSEYDARDTEDWCRAHFSFQADGAGRRADIYFHIAIHEFELALWSEDLFVLAPWLRKRASEDDPLYAEARQAARRLLYSRLVNAGRHPWKIVNLSALDGVFAHLWIALASEQLSTTVDDLWDDRAREHRQRFEAAFDRLNLLETDESATGFATARSTPVNRSRIRRA